MILPFVVAGLVLGSLYALSGVGMLVLYRTTGVLNFGYGALGAMSAMLAWQFAELRMQPILAYALGILVATALSLLFGFLAGPFLATVSTLTKATATLGLALDACSGSCCSSGTTRPASCASPPTRSGSNSEPGSPSPRSSASRWRPSS